MPARPKGPWKRHSKGKFLGWYMRLRGKTVALGVTDPADSATAWDLFHQRMSEQHPTSKPTAAVTVRGLCGLYLAAMETDIAPGTFAEYSRHIRSFAKFFGEQPVTDVRPYHVGEYLAASHPGINHTPAKRTIKRLFRWSNQQGYIDPHPLAAIKVSQPGRRTTVLTPAQRKAIYEAATDAEFRDLLAALEDTGARVNEVRRVEARHYRNDLGAWVMPATEHKTGKATGEPRVIPLTPRVVAITERLAARHPTGALLRNARGEPWTSSTISDRFKRLRKRLRKQGVDVPADLCGTHFRHSMATELVAAGVNLDVIRQVMGHRSFAMLSKHYLHAQNVELLRAAITSRSGPPRPVPKKKKRGGA